MKRIIIVSMSVMLVALAFGQAIYKGGEIRLSPRLLNYQGFLTDTLGNPITNPAVPMVFAIYDAVTSGNQKWTETQWTVNVNKGIFHVLLGSVMQIPDSVFNSTDRWLELTVYGQTLTPRTLIVSAPYAYIAAYSDTAIYARNSTPDKDWNYLISDIADTTLQMGGRWGLARSGNMLYGNADSTHVNFGIACTTGTSGQNYKYATVSGGFGNMAGSVGATVGGGWSNSANGGYPTIGGGESNTASGPYATVGGGRLNAASAAFTTVGGGFANTASGDRATVAGGYINAASGNYTAVGGGNKNSAIGDYATVSGGDSCIASNGYATVAGGYHNSASNFYASVNGGKSNSASGDRATINGGDLNYASGTCATVGGGMLNDNAGLVSVIAGGYSNTITAAGDYSFLFGLNSTLTQDSTFMVHMPHVWFGDEMTGYEFPRQRGANGQLLGSMANGQLGWFMGYYDWIFLISDGADTTLQMGGKWGLARQGNVLFGNADSTHVNFGVACTTGISGQNYKYSTVSGGLYNKAGLDYATVCGGFSNIAGDGLGDTACTVAGGWNNSALSKYAFIGGGSNNSAIFSYTTVGGGYSNNAGSVYATVAGGIYDTASAVYSAVLGGYGNLAGNASADSACVAVGGYNNSALAKFAFAGGGRDNIASDYYSTVGGGRADTANGQYSTIGGGNNNNAGATYATLGGGNYNNADGNYAVVGGGNWNMASGICAAVGGGSIDTAAAPFSFAANNSAKVDSSDTNSAAFTTSHTTAKNQVRAAAFSTGTLDFAMDHPDDPMNKILNQYGVSSDEVQSQYSGSVVLDANGHATVSLPDYFDDINRSPRIQLTGVGSSDVYVAEDMTGNRFVIGGNPNTKVYWEVTAERKDIHAEIARIQTPVVQEKKGDLRGHSIDDDAMIGMYDGLHQKNPELFQFKTEEGRGVHEQSKRMIQEGAGE